ncbi:hypothetical protein HPB48_001059 [Haemaphysalis longicornis]|uniref:Tick transposon n=1 Tax=Haemaphysalis longicornis TaxID=44386 RepID=A0A9J6GHE5_HAELO|nr:hypothetical protein HPB48_001059 [Haemaphysalis longicornis]
MKEKGMARPVKALLISRVAYITPYLFLSKSDTDPNDGLLHKAFKQVRNLPMNTSTARLLQLGLHNTVSEHIEAYLSSQRLRLNQTPSGLALLKRLHAPCQSTASQPLSLITGEVLSGFTPWPKQCTLTSIPAAEKAEVKRLRPSMESL